MRADEALVAPITTGFAYEGHVGPVSSVSTSPFSRKVILSCGTDGFVKMFSVYQVRQGLDSFARGVCSAAKSSRVVHSRCFNPAQGRSPGHCFRSLGQPCSSLAQAMASFMPLTSS
jgi:WD40 repeat protein